MKKIVAGLAAALALASFSIAADFGPMPANYQDAAEDYISARLEDPRAVRYQFVGEPYQVFADIAGYEDLPCWAVNVRVKARLPNGSVGGYLPYTVIFLDGEPVAFEEDARRLVKA